MQLFNFNYLFLLLVLILLGCKKDVGINLLEDASLSLWETRGGDAEYTIENAVLTGHAKMGTANTFLCTKETYKNFILDFQVSIDPRLNSGVQIRSYPIQVNDGEAIKGYQVEIDPSDRAWSGGIYEENGRGWIHNLAHNEAGRSAFRNGVWNSYHIEAIDESIRVWVNGVNTANLLDTVTTAGIIGLQVHSISDEQLAGTMVQWKDIQLRTENLEKHRVKLSEDAFEINLLPNNLSSHEIAQGWSIPKGLLSSKNKLTGQFQLGNVSGDFELKLEYRINKGEAASIEYGKSLDGKTTLEYSILDDMNVPSVEMNNQKTGGLLGKMQAMNLSNPERAKPMRLYNQWSQVHIIRKDGNVQHWLNNTLVLDYKIKDVADVTSNSQLIFRVKGTGAYLRSIKHKQY